MSIRFSRVQVMTKEKAALFMVGGIPASQDDLACWTAFQTFIDDLPENEVNPPSNIPTKVAHVTLQIRSTLPKTS